MDAVPMWQKVDHKYTFKDESGDYVPHPFFDLVSFAHRKDNSVNFFPLTPKDSKFSYNLDLLSGQIFREKKFCKQQDVWRKYGSLDRPPYTQGIVPRLLDQLGTPQRVIVFGRGDFYKNQPLGLVRSYRIKIVGGVIHQYCSSPPCSSRSSWASRLLLVGVDTEDQKYENVNDLRGLKELVDWDYVVAFLQNERGRKVTLRKNYPAFRVIGEVGAKKSLEFAFKNGYLFRYEDMKTLRKSCHQMYDYMWESMKQIRANRLKSTGNEFIDFKKYIERRNVVSQDVFVETKKEILLKSFSNFFNDWYKKYFSRFYTCTRFVRPASINDDKERHSFFTNMTMYVKLEKLGYFYSCGRKAWFENPIKVNNERIFNPEVERGRCDDSDLDYAFSSAITFLEGLRRNGSEFFKFIAYDSQVGGSHKKLYSFVDVTGKKLVCLDEKNNEYLDEFKILPDDISWKNFEERFDSNRDKMIR